MTVEEVKIRVTADTASAQQGLKAVSGDLKGVQKDAEATRSAWGRFTDFLQQGSLLAAGALAATTAYVVKARQAYQDYMNDVRALQRQFGASAEDASLLVGQLKWIEGTAFDAGSAFAIFIKNLGAAQQGASPADVFEQLGIALKDAAGNARPAIDVLTQTRDVLSTMVDPAQRAAAAAAIFGRSWNEIAPWLTKSPSDLKAINEQLKDMGLVMSDKQMATFARVAGDEKQLAMYNLALQIKIGELVSEIEDKLLPALLKMADVMTSLPTQLFEAAGGVAAFFEVIKGGKGVYDVFKGLSGLFGGAKAAGGIASAARSITTVTAAEREAAAAAQAVTLAEGGMIGGAAQGAGVFAGLGSSIGGAGSAAVGFIGLSGGLAIAVAATTIAVMEAVNAFLQMRDAINQANQAQQQANSNYMSQYNRIAQQYGANSPQLQKFTSALGTPEEFQAQTAKDRSQGMVEWYNPASWFWHAQGGDFIARKATVIGVGEAGTERVQITPLARNPGGSQGSINVHIGAVYARDEREAEESARLIMSKVRAIQAATA